MIPLLVAFGFSVAIAQFLESETPNITQEVTPEAQGVHFTDTQRIIVYTSIGCACFLILIGAVITVCCKRRNRLPKNAIDIEQVMLASPDEVDATTPL